MLSFALADAAAFGACSANSGEPTRDPANGNGGSPVRIGASGGSGINVGSGSGVAVGGGTNGTDAWPSGCKGSPIPGEAGEYCQGPAYDRSAQTTTIRNDSGCGSALWGIARDFVGYNQQATNPPGISHPDFGGRYCCGNPLGTVVLALGTDQKPVYNPANVPGDYNNGGVGLMGPESFAQWYNDALGVNLGYLVGFNLVPGDGGNTRVFASKRYFPVDNEGFGNFNDYGEDGKNHNFGFTTELHTKFKYQGGEIFSFEGDDDLWVFIDKKLVIDLGGIHVAMQGSVTLDQLAAKAGLVVGQIYSLDLFNAERHPAGSNFKITTSIGFVDCGVTPIR